MRYGDSATQLYGDERSRGARTVRIIGMLIAVGAAVIGGIAVVPISNDGTVYPIVLALLVTALAMAGIMVLVRPRIAQVAAVVAGISAIQIAGIGVVASRDWYNFAGAQGLEHERTAMASWLAVALTITAVALIALSLWLLRPAITRHETLPSRWVPVALGLLVAVVVPALPLIFGRWYLMTAYGQFALGWSVPWGAGLALAGWLRPTPARAARMTVAASVVLTIVWALGSFWNVVPMPTPS